MEYNLIPTDKKQTIEPMRLYSYESLTIHLNKCIDVIAPTLDILPDFREHYTPSNIEDYYDKLKRKYTAKLKEWKNRGELWKN